MNFVGQIVPVFKFDQMFNAFLGAFFAFRFNWLHYKVQKREENITTLDFLRASLARVLNVSLILKEQIVQHRYKEAVNCKAALDNLKEHTVPLRHEEAVDCKKFREPPPELRLQIEHMSQYIYCGDFEWPIAQEKLGFLASPDPNLISLVGATKMAILTLNTIVHDINADILGYRKGEEQLGDNAIRLIIDKNKILLGQIDDVLYFTKKLSDVLNKFGHRTYGKDMKKMEFQLTEEKYKSLLPEPIDKNWEGYEWFPKKKKWWQSKTEGIKT